MKYDIRKRRDRLFKPPQQRGPLLPISIVVVVILLALFSQITPFQFITDININPGNVTVPPYTPTPTALPKPTDVHGGHIVFTCTRKDSNGDDVNQICMIRADGSRYVQLTEESTNAYYPDISPDGGTVIFALNQYDNFNLNLLKLSNLKTIQVTDNIGNSFSPDFSPDGRQIVFVNRTKDSLSSLWVMGSHGEDPHQFYAGPKDIVGAAWSPDGNSIAFTMAVDTQFTYEIFLLDLRHPDAAPRQLSRGLSGIGGSLDWSPDGRNLVFFAGPVAAREVYQLDVSTGAITQLTFGGNNAAAAYSPDGQYIVYNSLRNNNQADLYIMHADGHSTRQLTTNPEPDWQPQWGP